MPHLNDGKCQKCAEIFDKYPGFYKPLRDWFNSKQSQNPDFHINCAGRGHVEQESDYARGATRAHFGQSAHNYNCAIDCWFLIDGQYNLDESRFKQIAIDLPGSIQWYGLPGAVFPERPHFELKNWSLQRLSLGLELVESM